MQSDLQRRNQDFEALERETRYGRQTDSKSLVQLHLFPFSMSTKHSALHFESSHTTFFGPPKMMAAVNQVVPLVVLLLNVWALNWRCSFAYVVQTTAVKRRRTTTRHKNHADKTTNLLHQPVHLSLVGSRQLQRQNQQRYLKASSMDMDINTELSSSSSSGGRTTISELLDLPRHATTDGVNEILSETENLIRAMHRHTTSLTSNSLADINGVINGEEDQQDGNNKLELKRRRSLTSTYGVTGTQRPDGESDPLHTPPPTNSANEVIYANTYVDFGKVDTIGFDYDYTLVTYTTELLELLYDMALTRLVNDRHYPSQMLKAGLVYDPFFSVRGLAVDKETGWICHLSYTHKVAVAWEGREKMPTSKPTRNIVVNAHSHLPNDDNV